MASQVCLRGSTNTLGAAVNIRLENEMRRQPAVAGEGWPAGTLVSSDLCRDLANGVVLVATRDDRFLLNCTTGLQELGFEVVTAYSPMTAEYRLRRHNVRVVVFDARILGPVCWGRPGPILPASARMPFVLTNTSCLDASRRRLAASYRARCIEDGTNTDGVLRLVTEALFEPCELDLFRSQHDGKGRIVLIHDDNRFRSWLAEALRDDGHSVSEYRSPSEVPVARFREAGVVITEYRMGGEDGLAFADQFHAACPTVPVIMVTAHWEQEFVTELTSREFLYYLRKPLDYSVLHGVVRDLTRPVRDYRALNGGLK